MAALLQDAPNNLKMSEKNGAMYACCPTCGRQYEYAKPKMNGQGQIEAWSYENIPGTCRRCLGPMDYQKAIAYGEELAERERRPDLTRIGDRMRAMAGPVADTMAKATVTK